MKILVRDRYDDGFGEIWELDEKFDDQIVMLMQNEENHKIYELVKENGKLIIDDIAYWIDVGER